MIRVSRIAAVAADRQRVTSEGTVIPVAPGAVGNPKCAPYLAHQPLAGTLLLHGFYGLRVLQAGVRSNHSQVGLDAEDASHRPTEHVTSALEAACAGQHVVINLEGKVPIATVLKL